MWSAASSATATGDLRCPGCRSSRILHYPASRHSGRSVLGCRSCGLRSWAERSTYSHNLDDPHGALTFDYDGYVSSKREGAAQDGWRDTLAVLTSELAGRPGLSLFDVGAGDGEFLSVARAAGFAVGGNELHAGAIELAEQRYGISLQLGEIGELGLRDAYDALTMWCVMAHVEHVDDLLADAYRALKPGGIMFLQTPRWSSADRAALGPASHQRPRESDRGSPGGQPSLAAAHDTKYRGLARPAWIR